MRFILFMICVLGVAEGTFVGNCRSYGCEYRINGKCECEPGCYGQDCVHTCSTGCYNVRCDKTTGNCFVCRDGYHGSTCNQVCPSGCINEKNETICDKATGVCNDHCRKGFYGTFCNETCPEHCETGMCNQQTGECHMECVSPYTGDFCNQTATGTPSKQQHSGVSKALSFGLLTIFCTIYSVFLS